MRFLLEKWTSVLVVSHDAFWSVSKSNQGVQFLGYLHAATICVLCLCVTVLPVV